MLKGGHQTMDDFIEYLRSLGTLSEKSIKDDISRINSMKSRNIDFTKGEEYAKAQLEKSDLSESTIKSCLRLIRRYSEYLSKGDRKDMVTVVDFARIKDKQENEILENIREFKDYYEYCFIPEYEEKYTDFETNSIQIKDVHAVVLETKDKFLLVGIIFLKDFFDIYEVINWLKIYNIRHVDNDSCVSNASEIIEGIHFKGKALILYKKGNKKVEFNNNDLPEITEVYNYYNTTVNTSQSKAARKEPLDRLVVYLNDEELDEIPRLDFDIDNDYIICNGTLIKADYIDSYNNTLGFYRNEDTVNPIAYIADNSTEVSIDLGEREDESVFCFIEYGYIIDPYEI